tara:strand:+ start:12240 stop:12515 length:276 start_codon:yes stop_codon:yes gene_type:complete
MGIIKLIGTINAIAHAVPEIADLCETLVKVAKDYEAQHKESSARDRWRDKNAAIDAAIAGVQLHESETQQHRQTDKSPRVQVCSHCGSEVR